MVKTFDHKKVLFWLFTVLLTVIVLESLGRLAWQIYWGQGFNNNQQTAVIEVERSVAPQFLSPQVLHPYSGTTLNNRNLAMNKMLAKYDQGQFNVGLFGGSVANGVRIKLADELQRALDERGLGKKLNLQIYSGGGIKQPQQLMQLNFALTMGKHFDLVINMDGYNEAVLALGENLRRGVFPFYPRLWDLRLSAYFQGRVPADHETEILRDRYTSLYALSNKALFKHSALFGFVLSILTKNAENKINALNHELVKTRANQDLEHRGPRFPLKDKAKIYGAIADHWKKSTMMMNHSKTMFGYEYFHFLQPNQYLKGTKPLNEEEYEIAISPDSYKTELIRTLFPMFQQRGAFLKSRDFHFFDMTGIYTNTEDTVYRDTCCHVNSLGNQILAKEMVERIMGVLDEKGRLNN